MGDKKAVSAERKICYVALTGNPNCGKTTIFNALTGLRAKVGNYPGVTVERKEGRLKGVPAGQEIMILDLPGTYSFSPKSLDEQVARDVLFNRLEEIPSISAVVIVIDASNLQRNLYYATQVIELGYPVIIALNMMDVAAENGQFVNIDKLHHSLDATVIPLVASRKEGITALRQAIIEQVSEAPSPAIQERQLFCELPDFYKAEIERIAELLKAANPEPKINPKAEALLLLSDNKLVCDDESGERSLQYSPAICKAVLEARRRIEEQGGDWETDPIEGRYISISKICAGCVAQIQNVQETFSDKLDRIITHRVFGLVIFFGIMLIMFQSIFRLAKAPMEWIGSLIEMLGGWVAANMPPGALTNLISNGVITGVGAVVVFLPQILLLFLFLSLLEDTGYMARAAFIMDRLMSKVGLHGKSFIPLLSSFACAIPGIMATRTIESQKDRLVTILIAPLMSCSARLPVYTVLIAACIPDLKIFGFFKLQGLVLMGTYLLGILLALAIALIFKKTILKGEIPMLIMELPPYKKPTLWTTLRHMWERSVIFLRQAGTIILGINIILWFLMTYPKSGIEREYNQKLTQTVNSTLGVSYSEKEALDCVEKLRAKYGAADSSTGLTNSANSADAALLSTVEQLDRERAAKRLSNSFAGRLGRLIEPVIKPLGFDWKIGIGIVSSFAARETFVSTMAIIYNAADEKEKSLAALASAFKEQKRSDGSKLFTPLTGISLIVFYICALQCASTVVVVRRETNSLKWTLFQWFYLGVLAWSLSFLVWNIGRALGY
ncbi:MAG: ferrous iron transport protein B [Verrucomicrobiia bacterium]